ncbi:MAG: N(4)-(beta-N-acetylglucosaminyl)-L-asparaginase [bacterium]|nr:N(4)-(beta-N-acetylglucosaminyl)-L-asparaginase [bacterium]
MTTRRDFLIGASAGLTALGTRALAQDQPAATQLPAEMWDDDALPSRHPVVISTWRHGVPANDRAWQVLDAGGRALDAVEQGVRVAEADPEVTSVGYGGRPDREGHVTLDSCIMDETGNAGSVAFLQECMHPISVARKVMEETPHVMLVGEGARRFADTQGFLRQDLLTDKARADWQEWLKTAKYEPWSRPSNPALERASGHDTISMLAVDRSGHLSGACTTSGLAYKMHGRVGDSPIIGAALFVDDEVGAAAATGVGEEVMKTVGSFLIVELMRQGATPEEACREGVARIVRKNPQWRDVQVGYLAVNRKGRVGAYALQPGFQFAVTGYEGDTTRLVDVASELED